MDLKKPETCGPEEIKEVVDNCPQALVKSEKKARAKWFYYQVLLEGGHNAPLTLLAGAHNGHLPLLVWGN